MGVRLVRPAVTSVLQRARPKVKRPNMSDDEAQGSAHQEQGRRRAGARPAAAYDGLFAPRPFDLGNGAMLLIPPPPENLIIPGDVNLEAYGR